MRVFERVHLNRAWYNRLLENRQVIAEQLDAMAYIMQDCAKEERVLDAQEKYALAEIRYRAKEQGIVVEELHLIEGVNGRRKLELTVRSRQRRLHRGKDTSCGERQCARMQASGGVRCKDFYL